MTLRLFAPLKLNLYLRVAVRGAGGYHRLVSLMTPLPFGDWVAVLRDDRLSLETRGPFADAAGSGDDNLVLRAARLLHERAGLGRALGARLVLTKNIPVAAGLGGGSADAAAALRLLRRLWSLSLSDAVLAGLAAELGADVPFCLRSKPALGLGVGERLRPVLPLPRLWVVLVCPDVSLATGRVFDAYDAMAGACPRPLFRALRPYWSSTAEFVGLLRDCGNDLTGAACRLSPVVADVLRSLRVFSSCLWAAMSGSGSACYGLFVDGYGARVAADGLRRRYGWSVAVPLRLAWSKAPRGARGD